MQDVTKYSYFIDKEINGLRRYKGIAMFNKWEGM